MKRSVLQKAIRHASRVPRLPADSAERFQVFMAGLLCLDEDEILSALLLACSLVAFDGLLPGQFKWALRSAPSQVGDEVHLSWESQEGRAWRLVLSAITARLLQKTSWESVQEVSLKDVEVFYARFVQRKGVKNLEQDQLAWMALHLSGPLFEHMVGNVPMTALPDSAYARMHSGKALGASEDLSGKIEEGGLLQATLDGFLEPAGNDKNPAVVEEVVRICRRGHGLANHAARRKILNDCGELLSQAERNGPLTCLLISWVIALTADGTPATPQLSQSSISNYVAAVLRQLFVEFRGKDISTLSEEAFLDSYGSILESVATGQKKVAITALGAFHRFLVTWLDATPLRKVNQMDLPDAIPRANVVLPSEIDSIMSWLDTATCDERLVAGWRVALEIASKCRIRISEVAHLQLRDILIHEDVIEISITGGKTQAARRTLVLAIGQGKSVREFVARRIQERALPSDSLFGDPMAPKKIYCLGKLYAGINRLLKEATGDPQISFHTLSHSVISFGLEPLIAGGNDEFANPFHQFATDVAHASIVTTCSVYMHLFPTALRRSLDAGLSQIRLTSELAAAWSGKSASAVRKHISRNGHEPNEFYWEIIKSNRVLPDLPSVTSAFKLHSPHAPAFLLRSDSIGFRQVFNVLLDLASGLPKSSVALRQSMQEGQIERVVTASSRVLTQMRLDGHTSLEPQLGIIRIQRLDQVGISLRKARQEKFASIFYHLMHLKAESMWELMPAVQSWLELKSRNSSLISFPGNSDALTFLQFLKACEIEITHLCLFSANAMESSGEIPNLDQGRLFKAVFGIRPVFFPIRVRAGRPKTYLAITQKRVISGVTASPAATSMAGLNGLMFALAVWLELEHAAVH